MKRTYIRLIITGILMVLFLASAQFAAARIYRVPNDFVTIQEAIDDPEVKDRDTILVDSGNHAGAHITKAVRIRGRRGAVIDSGPLPWPGLRPFIAGFFFDGSGSGSGAKIERLQFEHVEYPVFSRGADEVTVSHCKMINPVQGITNWHGNRWIIRYNRITDLSTYNGGGIGIVLGALYGGPVTCNWVFHNSIHGILYVDPRDSGGYNGSGIVLYADFRWESRGADQMAYNWVMRNKIGLVSDTADVVDVCAIELTDTRNDPLAYPYPVIYHNVIGYNDLRDTELRIILTPEDLSQYNYIFRNPGKNRCRVFF